MQVEEWIFSFYTWFLVNMEKNLWEGGGAKKVCNIDLDVSSWDRETNAQPWRRTIIKIFSRKTTCMHGNGSGVQRIDGISLEFFFLLLWPFIHSRPECMASNNVMKPPCAPVNHFTVMISKICYLVRVCLCVYILYWAHLSIRSWLFAFHGISAKKAKYTGICVYACEESAHNVLSTYCYPSVPYFTWTCGKLATEKADMNEVSWRFEWTLNIKKYILFVRTNVHTITNKQMAEPIFVHLFALFLCFLVFAQSIFFFLLLSLVSFTPTKVMAIHQIENKVNCNNLLHEKPSKHLKGKKRTLLLVALKLAYDFFACVSKCLELLILSHIYWLRTATCVVERQKNTCYTDTMFTRCLLFTFTHTQMIDVQTFNVLKKPFAATA